MINSFETLYRLKIGFTRGLLTVALLLLSIQVMAAKPPKQLQKVINAFLTMENTSLRIDQIIVWRFGASNDSLYLNMDIKAGQLFHVTLPAFGMEIFVTKDQMYSLNHARQQVILESASPTALLDQLFVGGDLSDARFRSEKNLPGGGKRYEFGFSGDFSDWDKLSTELDAAGVLTGLILTDYDGNRYVITLTYQEKFEDFVLPDLKTEFQHYQIADLRDKK